MRRKGVRRIKIAGMSAVEIGPVDAPVEVVFLHANGFHGAMYVDVLRPLAVGRRILAVDMRGHGRTPQRMDPAALKDFSPFVDDLKRLLTALGAPIVLAGHSLGGAVSVLAAADEPERVRAVALVEPVISPPGPRTPDDPEVQRSAPIAKAAAGRRRVFESKEMAFEGYRGRGPFKTWPDEALWAYVDEGLVAADEGFVLRCDPAWEAKIYTSFGSDIWGALARGRQPLVVRAGEIYSTFPPASEKKLRELRPNMDFARIPGASHFLPLEQPDVAREAVQRALALGGKLVASPGKARVATGSAPSRRQKGPARAPSVRRRAQRRSRA